MIGIFDSGLGGMTVARAIEQLCPDYPFLYFGDLIRTPYGSKSTAALIDYSRNNINFLIERGATCIVVACNSASSSAAPTLTREFHSLPVIDVIQPAVDKAISTSKTGRIGIIGTRATISSDIYRQRIQKQRPSYKVYSVACPLLVPLVEEGWINKRETKMIIKKYLHPLRAKKIDTLILGCTHYPLLKKNIAPRIGKKVAIIDSSIETANYLNEYLKNNKSLKQSLYSPGQESSFFVSDLPSPVAKLANTIFKRQVHLEQVYV